MKLALAIITRDTKEDAELLKRLINNTKDYVDGIFVTTETKGGFIKKIKGIHLSEFKWINDFSAARNFNFAQVPEDYDYIMWSDIDDVWRGLEKLKLGDKDAYAFWYLYAFDEDKQPVVAHKKTMIVRNDGSFTWKGKIHEDLIANRDVSIGFIEDIHRMHLTNETRIEEAHKRNLEIAKESFEEDKDPRNLINLANSYLGVGDYDNAKACYMKFLEESGSNDEKYLARQRLADIYFHQGDREQAYNQLFICGGMEPTMPDAFLQLGQLYFDAGELDNAEKYLLIGLALKPSYRSMIVFNPRDYDYNPLNLLAKVYFRKSRPDLALPLLKGCLTINPDNQKMKELVELMEKEVKKLQEIFSILNELKKIEDKAILKEKIQNLPKEQRMHPGVCQLWNANFFQEESTGNDVVYYCGYTTHEWNPELFKTKGYGGSEEAVIHLSRAFQKAGKNVIVYANIGDTEIVDQGVTWRPFWMFNPNDVVDLLILWRSPKLCDYNLAAKKVWVDLHDVIQPGEFTKKRLEKIDKVFVKTEFHKELFPNIPEEKFVVVPNGVIPFASENNKDPMMILNTSSPDRSMAAVVEIYRQVKEQVPEAKLYWAYGWDIYDKAHEGDKKMMEWKNNLIKKMDEVGVIQLGKVPQGEINKWYNKANIFLYPTEFAEIHCLSALKAQMAGCQMITTDFAALNETVGSGVKIHSNKTKDNWCKNYQVSFEVEDPKMIKQFVEETVKALKAPQINTKGIEYAKKYSWDIISKVWINNM